MECLYAPSLNPKSSHVLLSDEESKHAKVLRLYEGDLLLLSSGTGYLAKAIIDGYEKEFVRASILECRFMEHELRYPFDIALPLLSSKERMEFCVEKLTELGIRNIFPFISERTQIHSAEITRMQAKALSAMKQSKRSILPTIHPITMFQEIVTIGASHAMTIIGEVKGLPTIPTSMFTRDASSSLLLCIGPEGGFTDSELLQLKSMPNIVPLRLGKTRLRAETAALALASAIIYHFD